MIDDIHALVANSEVSDAAAEKLLPIVYWLEAELQGENKCLCLPFQLGSDYKFWIKRCHGCNFELITIRASDSFAAINALPKCVSWDFSTH